MTPQKLNLQLQNLNWFKKNFEKAKKYAKFVYWLLFIIAIPLLIQIGSLTDTWSSLQHITLSKWGFLDDFKISINTPKGTSLSATSPIKISLLLDNNYHKDIPSTMKINHNFNDSYFNLSCLGYSSNIKGIDCVNNSYSYDLQLLPGNSILYWDFLLSVNKNFTNFGYYDLCFYVQDLREGYQKNDDKNCIELYVSKNN